MARRRLHFTHNEFQIFGYTFKNRVARFFCGLLAAVAMGPIIFTILCFVGLVLLAVFGVISAILALVGVIVVGPIFVLALALGLVFPVAMIFAAITGRGRLELQAPPSPQEPENGAENDEAIPEAVVPETAVPESAPLPTPPSLPPA